MTSFILLLMKNYNQVTVPAGVLLILIGFVAVVFLPQMGINVASDWLAFFFLGGISCILLSIQTQATTIAGFVLLVPSLIFLFTALF